MFKMVVLDLDGTLLNSKKQVSKANAEIINKIHKEKGTKFIIATGRTLNDINEVVDTIGSCINEYVIAANGAIVKDNVKDEFILKKCISSR